MRSTVLAAILPAIADGATLPHADKSKVYLLRPFGNAAHEIWDVTDPAKPTKVVEIVRVKGTHKSWWECDTGIAYLVIGGWRVRRMTQVYDLSGPAHPKFLRNFGLPGPARTIPGGERCKVVIQTNNVEVDDRGYVYIVDRANTGLHILELTGEARKVANF